MCIGAICEARIEKVIFGAYATNKENFSILEIKEKNLPHTLINRNLLKSIA